MLVKDLIEILKKYPENMEVFSSYEFSREPVKIDVYERGIDEFNYIVYGKEDSPIIKTVLIVDGATK